MKTKIFSLCMALFAAINLFAYDFYHDGFYYDIVGTDSVEVINGDYQYAGNVVIPTTAYNGQDYYKVIGVGYKAFGGDSALISVTMGEHIKYIRNFAFAGSTSLSSISVSSNLQSCGSDLFNNCGKISVINITSNNIAELCNSRTNSLLTKGSIWSIPRKIWINGIEITELSIPNGITMIQDDAFRNCDALISVTIGNDVTHIGNNAFVDCNNLFSVVIGNGITHIGEYAFSGCENLNTISLGCLLKNIGKCSLNSNSIKSITLTAKSIDEYCHSTANNALYNSYRNSAGYVPRNIVIDGKEINTIEIPKTVDTISERLFYNCDVLQKIVIPTGIKYISDNAFNDCDSITTITIGENVNAIGNYAFYSCDLLDSVIIGNGIKHIGNSCFSQCKNLANMTIGSSLETIGSDLIRDCPLKLITLTSHSLEEYCNSITNKILYNNGWAGSSAARKVVINDEEITSLNIPSSVDTISERLFWNCDDLTDINIPNNTTYIAKYAFDESNNLTNVTIGNGIKTVDDNAFRLCGKLKNLTIGASLAELGQAFYGTSITSIRLSANSIDEYCKTIANNLLYKNSSYTQAPRTLLINGEEMTSLVIPNTVDTISERLFWNCDGLTDVTILDSVKYIADYAFNESDNITTSTIGNGVFGIGRDAYKSCDQLLSVSIGSNVATIGNTAFYNNYNLKEIICHAVMPPTLDGLALTPDVLSSVYIPCGTSDSYKASSWNSYCKNFVEPVSEMTFTVQTADSIQGSVIVDQMPTCNNDTAIFHAIPNPLYEFIGWSDGNTDNPRTLVLTQDTSLVAHFEIIYLQPDTVTLCYGETYQWHDKTYDASGVYIDTLSSGVATLHLTILPQVEETTEEATICVGDTYTWQADGKVYAESGTYSVTLQDMNGCDSVVILHLTVNPIATAEEHVTACDSYTWNGETYTESGDYVYTTVAANGCDSIITLHLTINHSEVGETEYATICYGETYTWNGQTYSATGEYSVTLSTINGCDSVATLHLTILPEAITTSETAVVGSDELPYAWRGNTYSATGRYTVVEQYTTADCDSAIHVLELTVLTTGNLDEQSVTICDTEAPYQWYGESYSTTGKYTYTEQYVGTDIDSIQHILNLTVNPTVYTEEHVTACDNYEWNGETYTQSGDYVYTTVSANGCDSIVTLHLTINNSEIGATEYATICYGETYTWNGQTYSAEGEYSVTLSTINGCDSVATLHLTILPEAITTTETAIVGSDELPYAWRGNTYSATGRYTVVEQYTTADCDSAIHVLELTVLTTGNLDEQSVSICDTEAPYQWYGESYSTTGKYTYTEQYVGTDIDSIQHVLNLMVNPTVYTEEHVTACDNYEWNGQTYTQSGDYVYTTVAANGCDSIVTLHLTINKSEREEYTATACDEYVWNGVTYTESGDYTYNTTTDAGCERVEVLHLTINKSERVEISMTACDSYEWHGVTYTESGDYTYTITTEQGCDRIETLHLTINKSERVEISMTACDSYEWHGLTYTMSGDYTYNTTAANGCDYVETLHLTILPDASTESEELALCPAELPYEWYGQTLTQAGTYSAAEQYAGMECDSVIHELTLNVYVQTLPAVVTLPIVRTGEAIDVSIPTAEIQAYIAAETWYAPNALVMWYIKNDAVWETLTDAPVAAGISQVMLKYAVDSDCGSAESEPIIISVQSTSVDDIHDPTTNIRKIIYEDYLFILRDGKIYNAQGQLTVDN